MITRVNSIEFKDIVFLRGLSDDAREEMQSCLVERSFKKGVDLFTEGDLCDQIFIVKSGRVKIFRKNTTGREQILEVLAPGETCACNPGEKKWRCSASAVALTPCRLWYLDRARYSQFVKTNKDLSESLMKIFAQRLCRFSSLIENVSLDDPRKRLIKFIMDTLNEQESENPEEENLRLSISHEEIAQRIGLARETVTRHLQKLRQLGCLDIKARQIIVLNEDYLKCLLLQ